MTDQKNWSHGPLAALLSQNKELPRQITLLTKSSVIPAATDLKKRFWLCWRYFAKLREMEQAKIAVLKYTRVSI
jgi:hypothetical protein